MDDPGAKKKLTEDELFAYRLCRDLDCPHPDYLLSFLTWEQFLGWRQAAIQEPWGDLRADLRNAAGVMWTRQGTEASDLPELIWPYFQDAEVLWEKHKELERKRAEMGPEMEAKLKAARRKYWEEKRKNGDHN